ncbi:N-(5'-phosphoribosyl)anthranilate isomerase [Campylobacterota bacterium]|nr:N-(5'-phosphoribosyl)anthranilate isomerase [Campylobacterota bacterium]
MRVKICGITNLDDALTACEYGASAIGFVFYGKSPRLIAPEKAREIVEKLPPFVERVGLFVEQQPSEIDRICAVAGLGLAQIHTEVGSDFYAAVKTPILKVVRARDRDDIARFKGEFRLIDAFTDAYGGMGKRLAIEWFADADRKNITLAGGLRTEHLDAIAPLGFYAIDVSSGVEGARGVKDRKLIIEFLKTALK